MNWKPTLQIYLQVIGLSLLVQGAASLLVKPVPPEAPTLLVRFLRTDPIHAAIHVIWGIVLLGAYHLPSRLPDEWRSIGLGLSFTGFFLALGLLGVWVHYPFGLQLDRGENLFHFAASLMAGILALLVWKR